MIGIVLVSHSQPLAEAALDLALQMVRDSRPEVRVASGASGGFGTDAAAIAEAIDSLSGTEGTVVITDLGSAILSSELAMDLRQSAHPVKISTGPFVEGATAAVVRAATGGTLEEVLVEADSALGAKQPTPPRLSEPATTPEPGEQSDRAITEEHLLNEMGLHSRPAALLVKAAGRFSSKVEVTNATSGKGPVRANSMIGLLSLAASKSDVIRLEADGPDAAEAVATLRQLVLDGFGELP